MIDFISILKANPNGVFATQDGQGVKTRVFQHVFSDGNKVYFSTGKGKPVYEQIRANPNVSFCVYPPDFNPVLSVSGKAVFVDDMALKSRVLNENPGIKGIFNSPDNPVFQLFYIDVTEIETFSFAEGTKRYKL